MLESEGNGVVAHIGQCHLFFGDLGASNVLRTNRRSRACGNLASDLNSFSNSFSFAVGILRGSFTTTQLTLSVYGSVVREPWYR